MCLMIAVPDCCKAMTAPLPAFFRDNFSTDRMARFCVVWTVATPAARCEGCGGVILHGALDGEARFFACRDCDRAGELAAQG